MCVFGEEGTDLRGHAPHPTAINKISLTISSGTGGAPVELASGGRTGVRSASSKKGSQLENLGCPSASEPIHWTTFTVG